MDDKEILAHIDDLIKTEHTLREQLAAARPDDQPAPVWAKHQGRGAVILERQGRIVREPLINGAGSRVEQ